MTHERFLWSRANYWIGLALDLVLSAAGLAIGITVAPLSTALVTLLAGLVAYTLYEYVLHRWLYHGRGYLAWVHATHHDDPHVLVGAPVYFSLCFTGVHGVAIAIATSWPIGLIFGCTLLFGYGQQSAIHHMTHIWPHTGRRLTRSRLRKDHLVHHSDGSYNYGISTRMWDHVFGTAVTTERRRSTQALAPRLPRDGEGSRACGSVCASMIPGARAR